MGAWYEPPGGMATYLDDSDIVIIARNGVTHSTTIGALLGGIVSGYLAPDASGQTEDKCRAQIVWTGEYDDAGEKIWAWRLATA